MKNSYYFYCESRWNGPKKRHEQLKNRENVLYIMRERKRKRV